MREKQRRETFNSAHGIRQKQTCMLVQTIKMYWQPDWNKIQLHKSIGLKYSNWLDHDYHRMRVKDVCACGLIVYCIQCPSNMCTMSYDSLLNMTVWLICDWFAYLIDWIYILLCFSELYLLSAINGCSLLMMYWVNCLLCWLINIANRRKDEHSICTIYSLYRWLSSFIFDLLVTIDPLHVIETNWIIFLMPTRAEDLLEPPHINIMSASRQSYSNKI